MSRAVKDTVVLAHDAQDRKEAVTRPTDAKLSLRNRVLILLVLAVCAWALVVLAVLGLGELFF